MMPCAIAPTTVTAAGVPELLAVAIGDTAPARTARALEPYVAGTAGLAGASVDGRLIGVIGFRLAPCPGGGEQVTLLHLATAPRFRGRGVGTALVCWVRARHAGLPVEAETDADAVGFYRAAGFRIESLGEVYPGVERFRCRLGAG